MNLDIHYEDPDIYVINKPAGLLSVPGRGDDKYDSVQSRCQISAPVAMAAHRLDMATSGLLLIAKHKAAERHYKQEFAARRVEKRYIAVVHGSLADDRGDIEYPLITDWERRPRQKICYEHGKAAHTSYEVLARDGATSRVALTPHTGRSSPPSATLSSATNSMPTKTRLPRRACCCTPKPSPSPTCTESCSDFT